MCARHSHVSTLEIKLVALFCEITDALGCMCGLAGRNWSLGMDIEGYVYYSFCQKNLLP